MTRSILSSRLRGLAVAAMLLGIAPSVFAQDFASPPPVPAEELAASTLLAHDLTPEAMFLSADMVVKAVMIGLALASVVTWTVLLVKSVELSGAMRRQRRALAAMTHAGSLEAASERVGRRGTAAALLRAAQEELRLSADALEDRDGLKERIVSHLQRIEAAYGRRRMRGTGLLATIGSTSPFVGLFGTVWGIMNSFIAIAQAHTTNLAVVAPGIAQALLATAIGLIVAIPAVVFYNHFARRISAYKAVLADTAAAVLRLVSRDLSRSIAADSLRRRAAE